jgi:phosphatidate cytidylyltransferase
MTLTTTGVRVLSGVLLGGGLLALILFAPAAWTAVIVVAAILVGAWEWSGFLRVGAFAPRITYVLLTALLLSGGWWLAGLPGGLRGVLIVAAVWWLAALGWILFAPLRGGRWAAILAGWLTLVPAGVALLWFSLDPAYGVRWLLYVLLLVWAADTGAYFAGRAFGHRKLAPLVSPGKTWEGVVGGLLLAGLLAACAAQVLGKPTFSFTVLSLFVAAFSVVGDLSESMFKRHAGLKDSGHLIPGHGGMLDRIDSITAAAPLVLLVNGLLP